MLSNHFWHGVQQQDMLQGNECEDLLLLEMLVSFTKLQIEKQVFIYSSRLWNSILQMLDFIYPLQLKKEQVLKAKK